MWMAKSLCCLYFIRHIRWRVHRYFSVVKYSCVCVWKCIRNMAKWQDVELYLALLNKLFHIYYLIRSHLQAKRIKDFRLFWESLKIKRETFKCRLCSLWISLVWNLNSQIVNICVIICLWMNEHRKKIVSKWWL